MSLTHYSTDAEIANELREIKQRQNDIDKIEQVARAPLKLNSEMKTTDVRECTD